MSLFKKKKNLGFGNKVVFEKKSKLKIVIFL